ncbi:MAG: BLUF domain-containing protein [Lysobacteraceae bacterium]
MALGQLVYSSRQVFPFEGLGLVSLLAEARAYNARHQITGVLLHANGMFVQCLEGPSEAVNALYQRILLDPRHADIVLLQSVPLSQRHFGDWWMGCARVEDFEALARIRAAWCDAVERLDHDDVLSPGFVLMQSIWANYVAAGLTDLA